MPSDPTPPATTPSDAQATPEIPATAAASPFALPLKAPVAYAAALLSGLLYWLAFAGMDVWPLALVAWVPLIVALHGQAPRRGFGLGWLAGLTMNVCGFFWLQEMLRTFSGFPAPICFFFVLVVCSYQGVRIGTLGWLHARATARGWPAALVFAAAFAASELAVPVLFPWYYAATVHQVPLLTQVADLGGPILVGLVLVGVNLAIAEPLLARLEGRALRIRLVATGAAGLAIACAYGALRIRSVDAAAAAAPGAKVGVVQANMGLMEKRSSFDEGLRRHLDLTQALERDEHIDFVVWSETSAMRPVRDSAYAPDLKMGVGRRIGVPAIFGAVILRPVDDERRYVAYNTAVSTDATGEVTGRYDKTYLLMFGEYLPFGDALPILYKWSPNSGHFSKGTSLEPLLLDVGGERHRVTTLICYEDILPGFTNAAVRQGDPELLVNMTNDAWFGDTAEPWEHLALAQLRAVEHRRYLVRGTNSGVSAVVDPVGRVLSHTGSFQQASLATPIHWMRSTTVYELLGDAPWWLVTLAILAASFVKRRPAGPAAAPSAA